MQLLNNLFHLLESTGNPSGFSVMIRLSADHIIYKGHFPGHPVTPGVVFLQIVHELVEYHLKKPVRLVTLPHCKFLRIVNPAEENLAQLSIELDAKEDSLHVKVLGSNSSGIFLKLNAVYTENTGLR